MRKNVVPAILDQHDSEVVNSMRFLLIIIVLFIHMLPENLKQIEWGWNSQCLYDTLTEGISHNIGQIAVPGFFLLSGYFFFSGVAFETPVKTWLIPKWKKRLCSLVVPYIAWNLIMILAIIAKSSIWPLFGGSSEEIALITKSTLYTLIWGGPIDFPLWYLRDLICMVVLAPLFFWLFKYLRTIGLAFILVFYFCCIDTGIPGFSRYAISFFGTGAFLCLNRINILQMCRRVKFPAICLSVLLLIVAILTNGTSLHKYIIAPFIPAALATTAVIMDSLPATSLNLLSKLSGAVFFIFATHEIFITGFCNGLSLRIFGDTLCGWTLRYCIEPFIILFICLLLFQIIKKMLPKTLYVLCGSHI